MTEHDQDHPNHARHQEPAEGSREPVRDNGAAAATAAENTGDNAGGITNRPLSRERREQEDLPPRGERKDGGSHA